MTEQTPKADYRSTVFLPTTSLPMKAGLPEQEPKWLAKWAAEDLHGQLRAARKGREKFILHDGPPYANGDMHIGHALNHILKDLVCRTQSLLGKDAPYVPGWDCHGLPIEWKVEEQYRKKKLNKDDVPLDEFRAECRAYAQGWVDVQRAQLKRLGISADWDNPYLTMDFAAEATIVSELMKFAESGQLYRGSKPVMWSCVEKTALAEAEVEYEDIVSTQIDVAFEIIESPIAELVGAYAVIWTTTPWTIPANQAIAYGPEVEYVLVEVRRTLGHDENNDDTEVDDFNKYIVASMLYDDFMKRMGLMHPLENKVSSNFKSKKLQKFKGSDLAGTFARHPMHASGDFFAKPRPFLPGDFVTTDAGTGLVHMAPDHGEDDFDLCKAHGIDPVFAVMADGKYRDDWAWLGGQGSVINPKFNAPDGPICTDLQNSGSLMSAAPYPHSYPHSWRSKAKLIYRCTPQWFVPMDKMIGGTTLRETAIAAIADTRFVPEKGRNRISAMVEGRPDWVLSRQRAWGVPIPLFVNRKSGHYLCDAAVNARIIAAVRASGVDAWCDARAQEYLGADYHADDFERVRDILDVWFDSGCTHVFTLESGRWPDLQWPADLYLEGSDQHRGWFQSSLLESCGTRGRAPYKAVLTHGFTMDAKGLKMSKSLGNTINPLDLMRDYGADILRMWVASIDFTEDHRIGKEILTGVADQYRKLRNTLRYLLGALHGFDPAEIIPHGDMPALEHYLLHKVASLDAQLRQHIDSFEFTTYFSKIIQFCTADLSAFYFDIRKDSLYCDGPMDVRRRSCRTVMDIIFRVLTKWLAPILVFTAEEVWQSRYGSDAPSIHLGEYEAVESSWINPTLSAAWENIRYIRSQVTAMLEIERREKRIGSSLESAPVIDHLDDTRKAYVRAIDFAEVCITSGITILDGPQHTNFTASHVAAPGAKCVRCWKITPEVCHQPGHPDLCRRCHGVVAA